MNRRFSLPHLLFAAGVILPGVAGAQSVERDVERLAESVASLAERLAVRIERSANDLAKRLEKEFSDERRYEHRRRNGDLPYQAMRIDTTFAFSADGTLDLTAIYGDIVVTGWDRNEASVKAWTRNGRLEYDFSRTRIVLEHVRESRRVRDDNMRYEISVPRGVRVVARSTSGDVDVRRTGGEVEAVSTSGDVIVSDATGRIEARTVSGDVNVRGTRGRLEASSVSGDVVLANVDGDLHVSSTSGDISVTDGKSRDVEASTTSGDLSWDGVLDASGRYEFRTHSGDVTLTIPSESSARFAINTYSGDLGSAFPITLQPGELTRNRKGRQLEFSIGGGGARIIAESFSGSVDVRKR